MLLRVNVGNGALTAGQLSGLKYCKAVIPLPGTGLPSPDDRKGWGADVTLSSLRIPKMDAMSQDQAEDC
jgi:hypothetical protein